MSLKRKRSGDSPFNTFASNTTHTSPFSTTSSHTSHPPSSRSPSPLARLPTTFEHNAPTLRPSDLNSRTRKRVRDNRPNESVIHETTLQKLFAGAQQERHQPQQELYHQPQTWFQPPPPPQRKPQPSLHAFWHLPAPAPQPSALFSRQASPPVQDERCEDCGVDVFGSDDSVDAMDVDDGGGLRSVGVSCDGCRKRLCGSCSVERSGVGTVCLGCAVVR